MLKKDLGNYFSLKNNNKNYKIIEKITKARQLVFASVFAILISGCGGGGGSNKTINNQDNNTPTGIVTDGNTDNTGDNSIDNDSDTATDSGADIEPDITPEIITISVKGGSITNSKVQFFTLGGVQLLGEYITDQDGKIEILQSEWSEMLIQNNLSDDSFIQVKSIGGDDLDSDNDGDFTNTSPQEIEGSMNGLVQVSNIEGININPITSYIYDVIIQQTNNFETLINDDAIIDSIEINKLINTNISGLGITDLNEDNIIDNQDILIYKYSQNSSILEKYLEKTGYLSALYSGNIDAKNKSIDRIQTELLSLQITEDFQGEGNLLNISEKQYISEEDQEKKTELETSISGFSTQLDKNNTELTELKSKKTTLNTQIIQHTETIATSTNDLAHLNEFSNNVGNIDFKNDTDDNISDKIEELPNVASIIIPNKVSIQAVKSVKQLRSRTALIIEKTITSNNFDQQLIELQARKTLLEVEIRTLEQQISNIILSIAEKDTDISAKQAEIITEQNKLDQKQKLVKVAENALDDFKETYREELKEYNDAKTEANQITNELENIGTIPHIFLNVASLVDRKGVSFTIKIIEDRVAAMVQPSKYNYQLDTTTKEYSDLFYFYNTIVDDIFGITAIIKTEYGSSVDFPARIKYVKNGNESSWIEGVRNKQHKADLEKFIGAVQEKNILVPQLEKLDKAESTMFVYAFVLTLALEVETALSDELKEYTTLRSQIKPIIDNLKVLKSNLENALSSLNGQKVVKNILENKKTSLISQLSTLNQQIVAVGGDIALLGEYIDDTEKLKTDAGAQLTENIEKTDDLENDNTEIEVSLDTLNGELSDLNEQIDSDSQKLQSYTASIPVGGMYLNLTIESDEEGGSTKEVLLSRLEAKVQQEKAKIQVIGNYLSGNNSYEIFSYALNGKGTYPAIVWGSIKQGNTHRITPSYTITSAVGLEKLGTLLYENLEFNIIENFQFEYKDLYKYADGLESPSVSYKEVVHYMYYSSEEKYPAKVGINYKIGNHEFVKYSDILAESQEQISEIIAYELSNNSPEIFSEVAVNVGETIWDNGQYITMIGGEYKVFETPSGFIATYKVANRGEWHIGSIHSDLESLKTILENHLDSWVERNKNAPVSEDEDRSDVELEGEEINQGGDLEFAIIELTNLYNEYQLVCLDEAAEKYPTTGKNSLETNGEYQIKYYDICLENLELKKELYSKINTVLLTFDSAVQNHINTLVGAYYIGKGFTIGYSDAIYDQAEFINGMNLDDFIQGLGELATFTKKVAAYWPAQIHYATTQNSDTLAIINQIEQDVSFGPEVQELTEAFNEIDWDNIENKEYMIGYLSGYITENIVIGYGIGKINKGISAFALLKIKSIFNKITHTSKLLKILNINSKVNHKGKMLTATTFSNLLDNKVRELYGSIESVKDILKISEPFHFIVGNGGGALNLPLRGKSADIIGEILESKGWVKTEVIDKATGKPVQNYISPDGKEKVIKREHSTSGLEYQGNGYKVEKTIDLLIRDNEYKPFINIKEIKFISTK